MILMYFLAGAVLLNLLMYLFAYLLQTDKVTDISYSATFIIIAAVSYYYSSKDIVDTILLFLVLLWGMRLGGFLFYRILKMGHDDRFNQIRVNPLSFLTFWIMQGLTCGIVSFSFLQAMQFTDKSSNWIFILGAIIAILGWIIETIADYQKFTFKTKYPTNFIQHGLWKHLRHPNYTGELMFWWGIYIATIPFANFYISLLSPVWISLIIIKFSGIPILEKKWAKNYTKNEDWQIYYKKSWRLIPFLY